jgi:DNA-binding NtrC family response regulator
MLTRFFLVRSAKELGVDAKRISEAALQRLVAFDFPGNVRQLENVCHWITVMAPAQVVEVDDLPPELQPVPRPLSIAGYKQKTRASARLQRYRRAQCWRGRPPATRGPRCRREPTPRAG